jgi:hypothetical protein
MRVLLILLQAFLAISAMPAGLMLMWAPDGHLIQLPLAVLTNAPFTDFFWPGAVLFTVLGLGHAVGLVLTWRRARIAGHAALMLGAGTVIWIVVQVIMTEPLFWMQGLIGGLGLAEVLAGVRAGRGPER